MALLQDGSAALHAACPEGHAQVAELLLQAGASVKQETEVRWSVGQDCVGDTEQCTYTTSPPPHTPVHYLESKRGEGLFTQIFNLSIVYAPSSMRG